LTLGLADPVEMKLLHMITADPARTPTFTWFALPDYFLYAGAPNCNAPCVQEQSGFVWSHGDVTNDITKTWLGMVGPGVSQDGIENELWSDHTDIRPTMLALLGLKDDYEHDGRVLFEVLNSRALPRSLNTHREILGDLARIFKEINAPVNSFSLDSLKLSTKALKSGSPSDDSAYVQVENSLISFTTERDDLATKMIGLLESAAFNDQSINIKQAKKLIMQGESLLERMHDLANMP
jgi:hypothetical protein